MKTTTGNFDTEKNKLTGARLRYLIEIVTSGGTVYYSDQDLSVEAQAYITKVLNWGRMVGQLIPGDDAVRIGDLSLQLVNFPRIDADILPGDEIRFYVWFLGLAEADKLLMFNGNISDDISWNVETISFRAKDKGKFFDKLIGQPLSSTTYPNADPDDLGKTIPIIYGNVKNHTPLVIIAGGVTTLTADILSTGTANVLVTSTISPIIFGSSGSFYVGQEKFNYSGKTDISFTGISRPGTKVAHSNGDGVFEDHALKYLVADHITKTSGIINVRLMPKDGKLGDAVNITSSVTINTDDSGKATIAITAANAVILRNLINVKVDQQPDVSLQQKFSGSAIHNHDITGLSQVTIYGIGVDSQSGVTDPGNAFDQNFDTTEATLTYTSPISAHLGLDFSYAGFNGLVIKQAVACIRVSVHVSSNIAKLRLPGFSFGLLNQDLNIGGGIATQKFIVAGLFNETDWSKLDTLRILVAGPGGPLTTDVYQMWWEISYEPSVSNKTISDGTIATTDSTKVIVTGNSQADSLGVLICDVEGYMDDTPKHYTDSDGSLIEEPWDVMHHLIENHSNGAVDADIDLSGSFQDAEDNLPASYKFAFAITDQRNLNRQLAQLAVQTYCRFVWEAGVARLLRIKTSGSPDKSIDTDNDTILKNGKLDIRMRRRGLDGIVNNVEVKYNLNLTLGGWSNPDAYEGTTDDNDATSIAAYGKRSKTYLMYAVGDNSPMADDLRDKYLDLLKDPMREMTFTTFLKNIELERGDLLSITSPQFGLSNLLGEVINTEFLPGINPEYRITCLIPAS